MSAPAVAPRPSRPPEAELPPESRPLLDVRDLAVSFETGSGARNRAVDGISLSIYPRQTLAVVGESGCGKSVTALSLMRLLPPTARIDRGAAMFRSASGVHDLVAMNERDIRAVRGNEIAMIFQEPMTSLNPVFPIGEQIAEAVRIHQRLRSRAASLAAIDALRAVGIADPERRARAYPHQFSGGMRQRVMIAMALACRPRLLLADEPTTALDVTTQAQILDLLRSLQRERDLGLMLITHDLGLVARHADVVCVTYAGRVVEYAPAPELFANPLHPYTRALIACIPRLGERRDRLTTITEATSDPARFIVALEQFGIQARAWWPWHDPPDGVLRDQAASSRLCEARPEHWVGVWSASTLPPPGLVASNFRHPGRLFNIATGT